jgi:hypothetical protein
MDEPSILVLGMGEYAVDAIISYDQDATDDV